MIRLGLLGANGRMGQEVQDLLNEDGSDFTLLAAVGRKDDPSALLACDAVLDFSLPDGLAAFLAAALGTPKKTKLPALVTGTTGLSDSQKETLKDYAARAPVLQSSNFSIGVFFLIQILKAMTPRLHAQGFTSSIAETHHIHKKDSPSGTALALQLAVEHEGAEAAPITSQRKGEIVGEHTVMFETDSEALVFHHSARDRGLFARGALACVKWAVTQRPGFYGMEDAFGQLKP